MAPTPDPFESTRQLDPEGPLLEVPPDFTAYSLDLGSFRPFDPVPLPTLELPNLPGDRFRFLEILGRGGHGVVARAEDLTLGRQVAVKWLRSATAEREALLREARTQASLEHPHICRIYEVGLHEGRGYIVMQLVDGLPITQALAQHPLPKQLDVLRMAAEAVHAAHLRGLIHRDLKPGNLLVEQTQEGHLVPRILDFGLATQVEELRRLHREGFTAIAGTPAYMAPEQTLMEAGVVDQRADIWALGVILFEVLIGELPFPPSGGIEGLTACQRRGIPDPWDRQPRLDPDLRAILLCALARHPWDRYATARDFALDLERFIQGRPVSVRTISGKARAWKQAKRHPAASLIAGMAILVTLSGFSYGMVSRRRGLAMLRAAVVFDRQGRDLEHRLDQLRHLPPERLGQAYSHLRQEVARLESLVQHHPRWEQGPIHTTLGRLHLAMRDPERARQHFVRAQALGFRNGDTGLGLGLAEAECLALRSREAAALPLSTRARRLHKLRQELEQNALRLIRQHRLEAAHPDLIEAHIHVLEGREEAADRLLSARLSHAPWADQHRRLLADLRTQSVVLADQPSPEQEATALAIVAEGMALAPGDPIFPLCEARLHLAACRRAQRGNRFPADRLQAGERAALTALNLDPDLQEAARIQAELSLVQATILSNRTEDARAAWDLGYCRLKAALHRFPAAAWPRLLLLRAEAERAFERLGPDNAAAGRHAEAALAHARRLEASGPPSEHATAAALACLVQARLQQTSGGDALPACEVGLAYLNRGAEPGEDVSLQAELLMLRTELLPDGRTDQQRAMQLHRDYLRLQPRDGLGRVNLAILLLQIAEQNLARFGEDPMPRIEEARAELLLARKGAPDLEPRIEGIALLLSRVEALHRLEVGDAISTLLGDMQRKVTILPSTLRPSALPLLLHLQLRQAECNGDPLDRAVTDLERAARRAPDMDLRAALLEGDLAAARVALASGRRSEAQAHHTVAVRRLEGLKPPADLTQQQGVLLLELDLCLLACALDSASVSIQAARARAAAGTLLGTWPGTPTATWAHAVASHLEGHPQDWDALARRWPGLRGRIQRNRPFLH